MLKKINKIAKEYQPLINLLGFSIAFIGLYFTFLQISQANKELQSNLNQFNKEQLPSIKFEPLDKKNGILKVSIVQSDMLFQSCRVTYHDSLIVHQESIGMHDSIWYNAALFSFFNFGENIKEKLQSIMNENKFNSYVNLRTPVLLEFQYMKYGELMLVKGIFDLEFSYFKNYRKESEEFESEIRAVYFRRYLEPKILYKDELNKLNVFEIINGS